MTAAMPIITDTESLAAFCSRLEKSAFITVDTEFMREKTYYPKLCVIQLASEDEALAVDAMAEDIDLSPLLDLMANEKVLKVFHAARQDLEIFYHLMGKLPAPLFDSQVAAMVCGFGESVGYETLVKKLAGAVIDKSSRFTDWAHRPLTDRQIKYALADVTHLRTIYEKLSKSLGKNARYEWLDEELAKLTDEKIYQFPPREAWRRVKSRGPKPRFLAILREVAAWREEEAQRKDIPRNRILRDEALSEIAHHVPKSVQDLSRTRGLGNRMAEGSAGKAILKAVAAGLDVPKDECPQVQRKPHLPRGIGPVTDILKVLLKMKCEEHEVAQKLVAGGDDVEKIAAYGDKAEVAALHGWRQHIFGNDALLVRDGKVALVVEKQRLELVEFEED